MPNIKMKKREYKDCNAIFDVMYYCLNHDLRYYNVMYLPVRNDCMKYSAADREEEVRYMADFWNMILDGYNKNSGKRFNHYVIGIGYENHKNHQNVYHYSNIIPTLLLEYLQENGLFGLVAYHVTSQGYHHIHLMIGITNIYGKSIHINPWTLAIYLNTNIPYLKMQPMDDDCFFER